MGTLVYGAIQSLDGYVADEHGDFHWAGLDTEVLEHINEVDSGSTTEIYGRKLYEAMKVWQTMDVDDTPEGIWAGQWQAKQKIVVSTTLASVDIPRTTLLRSMDAAALRDLTENSTGDITIGGPTLAAGAIRDGLVDEFYFFTTPVVVGGGLRALPQGARLHLTLTEERRFGNGTVFTRYRRR
jgi:dihydrofolate reductase